MYVNFHSGEDFRVFWRSALHNRLFTTLHLGNFLMSNVISQSKCKCEHKLYFTFCLKSLKCGKLQCETIICPKGPEAVVSQLEILLFCFLMNIHEVHALQFQ